MGKTKKTTELETLTERVSFLERVCAEAMKRTRRDDSIAEQDKQFRAGIAALEPEREKLYRHFVRDCVIQQRGAECFQSAAWGSFRNWRTARIKAIRIEAGAVEPAGLDHYGSWDANRFRAEILKLADGEGVHRNSFGGRLPTYSGLAISAKWRVDSDLDAEKRIRDTQPVDVSNIKVPERYTVEAPAAATRPGPRRHAKKTA